MHELDQGSKEMKAVMIVEELIASSAFLEECQSIEDIYMVGYPNGIWDKLNNTPIVRRGISATPLNQKFEGTNRF